MPSELIGILILAVLVFFFIVITLVNKKTPVPQSCEHAYHEAQASGCDACAISGGCTIREALDKIKEIGK
ncbi:hypothetical protein BN85302110 [Paracholeplasma brassicae]|jgi:hypothetical protein|uniref:Uncharacterized protein n=1 Tax=Acholeplasma brassicae TaxID=61635 RepID=U4KM97_9MOLU|nr:hypothetical protein [Paracholeplasma brassicae]CCV65232.1 hypothetical protein BN85302110 [Paracholeplasma brassicae]